MVFCGCVALSEPSNYSFALTSMSFRDLPVDTLLLPIAQKQQSYIKDTADFISFIENTKTGQDTILVAMDVSSLYTNIPQEEGIEIVCNAYETFHSNDPPIPTHYLREMLGSLALGGTGNAAISRPTQSQGKAPILDIKTHYKPTETFQYTHFTSCHPPGTLSKAKQ